MLKSLQQVNDWVYNATNGKMPQFLSALPPNLLIMLINAVHFKGISKTSDVNMQGPETLAGALCVKGFLCCQKESG